MDVFALIAKVRAIVAAVQAGEYVTALKAVLEVISVFLPQDQPIRMMAGDHAEALKACVADLESCCEGTKMMAASGDATAANKLLDKLLPALLAFIKEYFGL